MSDIDHQGGQDRFVPDVETPRVDTSPDETNLLLDLAKGAYATMAYTIEQRDEDLRNTTSRIRYRLSFPNAAQHHVNVEMTVLTDEPEVVIALPNWIPGSYHIRNFISNLSDLHLFGPEEEEIPAEWIAKNRLRVRLGDRPFFTARYRYFANERTVRTSHVNRFHAFLNPANCLMFVEGRMNEVHHVAIDHQWDRVTTALSPVRANTWGALNYDILADSPIEIGNHYLASYVRHGATHEIAITGAGDFDPDWITEQTKRIVDRAVELWGGLPYDRYVFFIQLLPESYGGLEHSRCSVNMFDSLVFSEKKQVVKFLALLCHEFFHTWNVKRIRPVELGPFDYDNETHTQMLWLAEGLTSYYDDLMAYRCGFLSEKEYLRKLQEDHLNALLEVPGRKSLSIKDSSWLSWVKLYQQSADTSNFYPSYYLKGGVIFLLLDMVIIDRSEGKKSLDDGMRALYDRYKKKPDVGVTEEEFISIVSSATGVDITHPLVDWLASTEELPIAATVGPLGLEWVAKEMDDEESTFGEDLPFSMPKWHRWLGLAVGEKDDIVKVVRVWTESPAERAGIGAEDEIVAVNGIRIRDKKGWAAVMRSLDTADEIRITAVSEDQLYETILKPDRRMRYELAKKEGMTADEQARFARWLVK